MKKFLTIITITLVTLICSTAAKADPSKTGTMTGTIGKYKVVMSLTFNQSNNTVTGWYYYASKGAKNKIRLSGTYRDQSVTGYSYHINMKESVNGRTTGVFDVDYYQQSLGRSCSLLIEGNFTTAAGKSYDVMVGRDINY